MRTIALTLRQFRYEQKMFRRTPAAMFFVVAFPVVLLMIFASLNRDQHLTRLGGISFNQYYTPSMAAFAMMSSCYSNLAGRFVYRRETGILKRFRASPLPVEALIGGLLVSAVVIGTIVATVNLAAGTIFYGAVLPHRWIAFILLLIVASTSFCAMAAGISSMIPSLDSADPIIWGTFMPLVFISGAFFPVPATSPLSALASIFPVQHLIKASFDAFNPHTTSSGIALNHLAVIAAWGVAGGLLARKQFKWEPVRK